LSRYGGNIGYVLRLPLLQAANLIVRAKKEKAREEAFSWWLARLPMYGKDNYETFEEFHDKIYPERVTYDTRSKDELMNEILGKGE